MLAEAEQAHASAAAVLAAAEEQVRQASALRRQADAAEAGSRAALVRADAMRDAADGGLAAVRARIAERLAGQDALPAPADLSDGAEERARRRAERLTREREDMGPVNLRAETELAELEQKAAAIEAEREALTSAVAKLRGAIGHLNREGRARLTQVFADVDRHFRTLFTRMMGGGRAHLALTGSDDPLLAGLEIYAEPPGKKLAALSLLSGGEQALTALSLIFAVFRCTPAPLSVLDEVDAPLDDANVERFCTLLDEMVRDTGTRFLVVTHHQHTMSRMDRLYGVTMQERGVSRLLSVDLQRAAALVAEESLQAAAE
jgi:chromosome segregation protein